MIWKKGSNRGEGKFKYQSSDDLIPHMYHFVGQDVKNNVVGS